MIGAGGASACDAPPSNSGRFIFLKYQSGAASNRAFVGKAGEKTISVNDGIALELCTRAANE